MEDPKLTSWLYCFCMYGDGTLVEIFLVVNSVVECEAWSPVCHVLSLASFEHVFEGIIRDILIVCVNYFVYSVCQFGVLAS